MTHEPHEAEDAAASETGRRQPWMKFYPSDWRADPALRTCSLAARGLWVELMCLMHEGEPHGHLTIKGRALPDEMIARLVGAPIEEIDALMIELFQAGVFSVTDDGTVYSRRMVRDRDRQKADQSNGKRGGNPRLKRPPEGG